jgi:lipopolysaccharide/colanic/teichoic acid biosynthesis glycosyltransferase
MDIVLSATALSVASPLLIAIAVLVRATSRGPILFKQARLGKGGKPFRIWKFRTMITNAPDIRNADGSAYSGDDDPRVTWIGRILRKTSLDEIPQLFNVLFGSMSLVGPRPDQVDQLKYYTAAEKRKLEVQPGLTGLAQISGRNSISWEQRKRFDIQYVDQQSLRLDIAIMVKTVPYVLMRKDIFVSGKSETKA